MSSLLSRVGVRDVAGSEILGCVRLRTENLENGFEDVTNWSSLTKHLRYFVTIIRKRSHRLKLPQSLYI
jgi:hypothetical protein